MIIRRNIRAVFEDCLRQFPSLLLTGARQSGKTTFVKNVLPDAVYLTFDDPLNRDFARQDPNGFLDRHGNKQVILDEVQYVPEIFQYLKIRIDRNRIPGKWILTGSQQFQMMHKISESLAGRVAILELAPFSLYEIGTNKKRSLEEILWNGLFPEPCLYPEKRNVWIRSYLQTYLERDVRQLENIQNLSAFETFVRLCAAFHSQEFHPAALSRDCGVSIPTVKNWARIMAAGYLCFLLPPFYRNYGKRVIKTPKFYYTDPALVCQMTQQPSSESALSSSMAGALFEGLIVTEVWKAFLEAGRKPDLFFWRSNDGLEIDLVLQVQNKLWPIEIKLTSTPTSFHLQPINQFKKLAREDVAHQGVIVCRVEELLPLPNENIAVPWSSFPRWVRDLIS